QPELLCIVVPRHPERFDEVFAVAQSLNLNTTRRSTGQRIEAETQVYLADSMGEMWLWYALSNACFVGGSLNEPGGGHNILEP
ncbi:3-deoxy-D-manno-octulosonic acid transferase, partial [bacterium LRH843]|nr:3-deoxy-D-manno-octulosonic acid transferase [bacterium LRH843]